MENPQDSPETHRVKAGVDFDVDLPRPGGAGYRWEVSSLPDGMTVTREEPSVNPVVLAAGKPGPTPGAPVVQRFVLRTTVSGTIHFQLRRPWEAEAVRTHAVEVQVKGTRDG